MPTISEAIKQARPARLHILVKMLEAIDKPRDTLSPHAPRLLSFRIDPELIGTVIGPGGRTIHDFENITLVAERQAAGARGAARIPPLPLDPGVKQRRQRQAGADGQ